MEAVRETTEWRVDYRQPNHVYLLDGTKVVAYIPWGQGEPFYFSKPQRFDRKGRTFEKLKVNPFKKKVEDTRRRVEGSKGAVYWVDDEARTCTCPGFVFRGSCKHLKPDT